MTDKKKSKDARNKASTANNCYTEFGAEIWKWITKDADKFFYWEESEEIMEIAKKYGLVKRVEYDPEKHGEMNCDPGDIVWWWENSV